MSSTWETTIGLEMHVQLATHTKIFSATPVNFGAEPNSCASEVDLALPGTLPVLNEAVVRMAIMFGLAVNGKIAQRCTFARKNYFYPDLPRGYQISQYDEPIVSGGAISWKDADAKMHSVNLTRAHLEEDAGKLIHDRFKESTAVDLNRAGTPLLEVVTEPEIHSATEAAACMRHLHDLVCALGICEGDMSQGSMRCDVNVSLSPAGSKELGTRTEMKNINSFRFVEKAILGEIERQRSLLEEGGKVIQQTRHYDASADVSYAQRAKEAEMDYRYFPDPDLLTVAIDDQQIQEISAALPELPEMRRERIKTQYQLAEEDTAAVSADLASMRFFEDTAAVCQNFKAIANWMRGDIAALRSREQLAMEDVPLKPASLAALIERIDSGTISNKAAKQVFSVLAKDDKEDEDIDAMIERLDLGQQSDSTALKSWVDEVLKANPEQVAQYLAAPPDKRKRLLGFFVGQIMSRSKGKADPRALNEILLSAIKEQS
jgi:aspartyl-tRNA(Asn)/glutamyl-tRNA(Gln) amidotransferase subunit B